MHRFWDIIVKPLINELKPKHIVEIGSENGFNTEKILNCIDNDSKLSSVDPFPLFDVDTFKKKYGSKFEMYEGLSHDVLPLIDDYDMVLLDGDHNWYTVYNELKIIEKKFNQNNFPIIIFHDVSWPYARRDLYYNPDIIPNEFLNPYDQKGMFPGENDLMEKGGLNYNLFNAKSENTPKNGVLTAIEDFINESELNLTLKTINAFHGLGLLYPKNDNINELIEKIVSKSNILENLEEYYLKRIIMSELDYINNMENVKNILTKNSKDIDFLNDEIHKRDNLMVDQNEDIQKKNKEIKNLKKNIKNKDKEISELKANNDQLKKEIDEIISSNSWKLTKPLRSVKNSFK